jgi:hypothetical protein
MASAPAARHLATAPRHLLGRHPLPLLDVQRPASPRAAASTRSVCRLRKAGICSTSHTSPASRRLLGLVHVRQHRVDPSRAGPARADAGPPRAPGRGPRPPAAVRLVEGRLEDDGQSPSLDPSSASRSRHLQVERVILQHARPRDQEEAACHCGRDPGCSCLHGLRDRRTRSSSGTLSVRPAPFQGGPDEGGEQRVRAHRAGLQFRVELAADEPRVIGQLDDLHQVAVGRQAAETSCRSGPAARGTRCSPRSGGGAVR